MTTQNRLYKYILSFLIFWKASCVFSDIVSHQTENISRKTFEALPLNSFSYNFIPAQYFHYYVISNKLGIKVSRMWAYPRITWFFPHNNEYDAKSNIEWAYTHLGGYSIVIDNFGNLYDRNLKFSYKYLTGILIDPNRMSTIDGLKKSLILYNKSLVLHPKQYKMALHYAWENIALPSTKVISKYWSKTRALVALHNNRFMTAHLFDNKEGLETALFPEYPPSTFVFVTNPKHFEILKKYHINAVYQSKVVSDGSFSDYAIMNHLPYINIETRMGNMYTQRHLIFIVTYLLLSSYYEPREYTS